MTPSIDPFSPISSFDISTFPVRVDMSDKNKRESIPTDRHVHKDLKSVLVYCIILVISPY
jgi:hypothetical protein